MTGALPSGLKARLGAACIVALLGAAAVIGSAKAEKVGVAAAVNPDAFSSLSGAPNQQLNIGKSIFYNERINTTTSGLVQVLLVDGSTFTVGPGSDLVIDKFVYNPQKQTGEVAASFSKGVMRYVGGKISKNDDGVKIKTPAGALAIRGGIVQAQISGGKGIFCFLYGVEMVFIGKNGQQYKVYQPGYTLDLTSGTPKIRPTTAADTNSIMKAFAKGGSGTGTADTSGTPADAGDTVTTVDTLSLQDMIADAAATRIDSTLEQEEQEEGVGPKQEPIGTDTAGNTSPPPAPTQVTMRVLAAPGTYTAYGTNFEDPASNGILGGDSNPSVTADDFVRTFTIENDRVVGTVSGLIDSSGGQTGATPSAAVNFPAKLNCLANLGICPVSDAKITQNGHTTKTYAGIGVLRKDFVAYHVLNVPDQSEGYHPEPILAFGGKGYNFGTPSGKTYAFILTPDVVQVLGGALSPFASGESSPKIDDSVDEAGNLIKPLPSVSPLLYLEKDSSAANDPSRALWLQTSLYINTTPGNGDNILTDQESFVNVALGGVANGGLVGARRGGSQVDVNGPCSGNQCPTTTRETYAFTGDIASLAGPDGGHFLGENEPNIVIGFDSTGSRNIGRHTPLDPGSSSIENQSGSTYHIGVGLGVLQPQAQTFATDSTFNGYAAGIVQSKVPADNFGNVVASRSPDDFGITFDKITNTLSANLSVYDVQRADPATGRYTLGFGDNPEAPTNKSAYIDDFHYAAIESGMAQVSNWIGGGFTNYQNTNATSYLVNGDQLGVTKFFPDTFQETTPGSGVRPFCTDCGFLKWGAWGTRVAFGNGTEQNPHATQYVDNVHLGWWVAAPLTSASDLTAMAGLDQYGKAMTATYAGNALGSVLNGSQTYTAAGKFDMFWNFNARSGNLTISQFDNRSFTASNLSQPNPAINQFSGQDGAFKALGSFANNGPVKAGGVLGNWNVSGTGYKATGIFAGSGTPVAGAQ